MVISERTVARLALAGLLVAALGMASCGRKGPLDLPPSAASEAARDATAAQQAVDPSNVPRVANDPPPGERRKPLPIDSILN